MDRIAPQTLVYNFEDQLPLYQVINRPEVYRCKAIVHFTILKWITLFVMFILKYNSKSFLQLNMAKLNSFKMQNSLNVYLNIVRYPKVVLLKTPTDKKLLATYLVTFVPWFVISVIVTYLTITIIALVVTNMIFVWVAMLWVAVVNMWITWKCTKALRIPTCLLNYTRVLSLTQIVYYQM